MKYRIVLDDNELSLLGAALDQRPFGQVAALVSNIQQQMQHQQIEAAKARDKLLEESIAQKLKAAALPAGESPKA